MLYANLLFATLSGKELYYETVAPSSRAGLWGERLFASAAFGMPPIATPEPGTAPSLQPPCPRLHDLQRLQSNVAEFCFIVASVVATRNVRVVGASTNFEQTAASFALLSAVKRARPQTICILGGANCQGEMAAGIASLPGPIDHIFSGECERVFPEFLSQVALNELPPSGRIIRGSPCPDLDSLPDPDFGEYFAQLRLTLGPEEEEFTWTPFETSRGCWYGEKSQCSFCGLNGETLTFRQKSSDRAITGLRNVLRSASPQRVMMADTIMPRPFFHTLLAQLPSEMPGVHIAYEVKGNLTLEQVSLLRQAGVGVIQPGIEALSSSLLRRMNKGVLARQNVALLRYARGVGLDLIWNLLTDFPRDQRSDYESTLALLPLLHHLHPPTGAVPLRIDRFSPYHEKPERHGIANLRPYASYRRVFPASADVGKLASFFEGDYAGALREEPDLRSRLIVGVEHWREKWAQPESPVPALCIAQVNETTYLLSDTRGLPGTEMFRFLNPDEAEAALVGGPVARQHLHDWAVQGKLAVELDGYSVPLAVSDYETMRRFEARSRSRIRQQQELPGR